MESSRISAYLDADSPYVHFCAHLCTSAQFAHWLLQHTLVADGQRDATIFEWRHSKRRRCTQSLLASFLFSAFLRTSLSSRSPSRARSLARLNPSSSSLVARISGRPVLFKLFSVFELDTQDASCLWLHGASP
eukprot:639870-Pleurochrysis_carterae.AAC.2